MCCMYIVYSGMQEWVIQIPSIPILVSVLFPSLHLKYFRIKFLLLLYIINGTYVGVCVTLFFFSSACTVLLIHSTKFMHSARPTMLCIHLVSLYSFFSPICTCAVVIGGRRSSQPWLGLSCVSFARSFKTVLYNHQDTWPSIVFGSVYSLLFID